jgi:hypothetical protein
MMTAGASVLSADCIQAGMPRAAHIGLRVLDCKHPRFQGRVESR